MKHRFIFSIVLLDCPMLGFAQKEIVFNDTNIDNRQIKVARIIQGVDFSLDPLHLLPTTESRLYGSIETHLRFFHENRIANTWTLNKSIDFTNSFRHVYDWIPTGKNSAVSYSDTKYNYALSLQAVVEPRHYFTYTDRYRNNKRLDNNSGWFYSFPLTISTLLYEQLLMEGSVRPSFLMNVTLPVTVGYRAAFSRRMFFEAKIGYFPLSLTLFKYNDYHDRIQFRFGHKGRSAASIDNFKSELKIAYTF